MTSQGIVSSAATKLFGAMYSADFAVTQKSEVFSDKSSGSFESVIKQNKSKTEYVDTGRLDSGKTERKTEANVNAEEVTGQEKISQTAKSPESVNSEPDKDVMQLEEDENVLGEKQAEAVAGLMQAIDSIVSMLMEQLGVTESELESMMNSMGIEYTDLANQDILKQLVLYSECGGDIMAALTDEGIADKLYTVLEQAQEIVSEFEAGGTSVEDAAALLDENAEYPDELLDKLNQSIENEGLKAYLKEASENARTEGNANVESNANTENLDNMQNQTLNISDEPDSGAREQMSEQSSNNAGSSMADEGQTTPKADSQTINVNQFIDNLVGAKYGNETVTDTGLQQAVTFRDIAFQIIEQVKVTVAEGQTSMQMVLSPESLGRVELSIVSKNGIMTAQLAAETQVAKEAIESQIVILRENIENQGLKVDAIEVTVSDFHFGQSGEAKEQNESSKKGSKNRFAVEGAELKEESDIGESLLNSVMELNGNTVNYKA